MNNLTSLPQIPQVFVIVLNWNNAPDSIECLESIFKLNNDNFQVLVCDNDSTDNSVELILGWLAEHKLTVDEVSETDLTLVKSKLNTDVVLIKNKQNYGYAGGNNRGLSYTLSVGGKEDFVWIVNNDTTFHPEALNALINDAAQRSDVGLFGSTILDYHTRNTIQTQGGDRFYPWFGMSRHIGEGRLPKDGLSQETVESRMSYVVGASIFIRLATVRLLGLMAEEYFLYFEEVDWAIRARRLGINLGYAPKSLVYHKEGGTVGASVSNRRKSPLADFYGIRNRLLITRRLFPWALPTVYLAMFLVTFMKRLLTGQLDRAWMVLAIMLGVAKSPAQPNQATFSLE